MRLGECTPLLIFPVARYCKVGVVHVLLSAGTARTLVVDSEDSFLGMTVVFEPDTVGMSVQRLLMQLYVQVEPLRVCSGDM